MSVPEHKLEQSLGVSLQTANVRDLRLVQRVLARWQDWRFDREFPMRSDIQPIDFGADWENCFILDRTGEHPFPVFETLGRELAKFSGIFLSGANDWSQGLIDKAVGHINEVHSLRDAVLVEDKLARFDGEEFAFRCILLPLSEDGRNITHILGAANAKLSSSSSNSDG